MKENKFLWIITMILLCVIFILLILKSYKLYDNERYITEIENELNAIEQEIENLKSLNSAKILLYSVNFEEIENLQNKVDENVT